MSQENVVVSFIGQKLSSLCWCTNRDGSLSQDEFLSGCWDDQINSICLWRIPNDAGDFGAEPFIQAQKDITSGSFSF